MRAKMGGGISLEESRSLGQVGWLLHQRFISMVDVKLNALLDWVSNHVKDFPLSGLLQLEAWQAVGQRLFNIASDSDAEACGHLSTWGTVTAAIKGNRAALEADCPEPSAPPEPLYDPDINPYFKEFPVKLPDPEINPSPAELP